MTPLILLSLFIIFGSLLFAYTKISEQFIFKKSFLLSFYELLKKLSNKPITNEPFPPEPQKTPLKKAILDLYRYLHAKILYYKGIKGGVLLPKEIAVKILSEKRQIGIDNQEIKKKAKSVLLGNTTKPSKKKFKTKIIQSLLLEESKKDQAEEEFDGSSVEGSISQKIQQLKKQIEKHRSVSNKFYNDPLISGKIASIHDPSIKNTYRETQSISKKEPTQTSTVRSKLRKRIKKVKKEVATEEVLNLPQTEHYGRFLDLLSRLINNIPIKYEKNESLVIDIPKAECIDCAMAILQRLWVKHLSNDFLLTLNEDKSDETEYICSQYFYPLTMFVVMSLSQYCYGRKPETLDEYTSIIEHQQNIIEVFNTIILHLKKYDEKFLSKIFSEEKIQEIYHRYQNIERFVFPNNIVSFLQTALSQEQSQEIFKYGNGLWLRQLSGKIRQEIVLLEKKLETKKQRPEYRRYIRGHLLEFMMFEDQIKEIQTQIKENKKIKSQVECNEFAKKETLLDNSLEKIVDLLIKPS